MRFCPKCASIYSIQVERCGIDGEPLQVSNSDPLIGRSIDRYKVVRRLGAGAMGCVYVAQHPTIDREFAVKVLFGEMASNQEVAERFRREAKSLSQFDHPNIVSVVDFGRTEHGLLYLVMELVRGKTLSELTKVARAANDPFEPKRAAKILRQIAAGLGEAHKLGFVHRDLKPGNVMIAPKGDGEFVKILDFGIVGLVNTETEGQGSGSGSGSSPLTKTGYILGTPAYMAPEQIGHPSVGPSADLYAMGVILYEMLCGKPPFQGALPEVFAKKLAQPPPPLPQSGGLEQLAMSLLEREIGKRPRSADEVIATVDQFLASASYPGPAMVRAPRPREQVGEPQPAAELAWTSLNRDGTLNQPATGEVSIRAPGTGSKLAFVGALLLGAGAAVGGGLWFMYGRDTAPVIIAVAPDGPAEPQKADVAGEVDRAGLAERTGAARSGAGESGAGGSGESGAGGSGEPGRADGAGGAGHAAPGRADRERESEAAAPSAGSVRRSEPDEGSHPIRKDSKHPRGKAARAAGESKPSKASRSEDQPAAEASARSDAASHPESTSATVPSRGSITVFVKSSGGEDTTAAIFVDNRDIGRVSPLKAFPVSPGKHHVEIRLGSAGKPRAKDVVVEAGKESEVFFIAD